MKTLGNSKIAVAPFALGGNVFGWTANEATSFQILDRFVEAGFNLIDTADVYSRWAPGNQGGESETVLGNWFKKSGQRSRVVLATKVGMEMGPDEKGLSRAYILKGVERSLNSLQTESIDLYQTHKDDETTPIEETLGALDELVKSGKVKAIGASNYSAARLSEALRISREKKLASFCCLQPLYNLYDREPFEAELQKVCADSNIAVIPYYSLGAGFLTGKYRSEADLANSARAGKVKGYLNDRGHRILKALDAVSSRLGVTQGQVALAWLRMQPTVTAPIASATSLEQLEHLIAATKLELDAAAIKELNEASAWSAK